MDSNPHSKPQQPSGIQLEMPPDAEANDTGKPNARDGVNLKRPQGVVAKHKSTVIASRAAGTLRNGTQMLLVHVVPETARNHLDLKVAMLIGLSVVILLFVALAGQIVIYGKCKVQPVLVAASTLERCSAAKTSNLVCTLKEKRQRKSYSNCKPQLLQHDDAMIIDRRATWAVHPNFRLADSLWRVVFVNYTATEPRFRENIKTMVEKLHELLDRQKGKIWYDVVHALRYGNITAEGVSGYMKVMANVDLGVLVGNKLIDWGQMRNLKQYAKKELPRSVAELTKLAEGRWRCSEDIVRQGYNYLQMKQKRAVTTMDTSTFSSTADGRPAYQYIRATPDGNDCVTRSAAFSPNPRTNRLDIPVLEDIVRYSGRQDSFTLEWDVGQTFVVDWCNKAWEACVTQVCPVKRGVLADNATTECLSNRLLELGSTEVFPTQYSPGLNRLGFKWSTGASLGSDNKSKTYFVVPELIPDFNCADCNAMAPSIDCQAFIGVELHYFLYNDKDGDADEYITSFEWTLNLDGSLNSDNARAQFHCDASGLKFLLDPQKMADTIRIPFDLTKGTAECDLDICRTWLERLSLSFSNVVLLYTILSVATIMGVMYVHGKKVATGVTTGVAATDQLPENGREPLFGKPPAVESSIVTPGGGVRFT